MIQINYVPAATFDEISKTLGMTRQAVWRTYVTAIKKMYSELKRQPLTYRELFEHEEISHGWIFPSW